MPGAMERSKLHVEGQDDQHSLVHLLVRHGVDYGTRPWPGEFPTFEAVGGKDALLDGMATAVKVSGGRAIGFVLDADSPIEDRWRAVRDRLSRVGVDAPGAPEPGGFIGHSGAYRSTVGVWLMPDSQSDGKLEDFLQTLIEADDALISHAGSATDDARALGAKFTEPDRIKAMIHAWLAWQEAPGVPYGVAMQAHYFQHDSDLANRFVAWFKRLYGIA